jgi:glutamate/aspartate transport system substrate-binding protein
LTLTACAVCAAPVAAQDTLKKIRDSGAITIGHRDASIPFSYYDDKQQPLAMRLTCACASSMPSRPSSSCPS